MVFTLKRKLFSGFLGLNVLMAVIGGVAVYNSWSPDARSTRLPRAPSTVSRPHKASSIRSAKCATSATGSRCRRPQRPQDTLKHLDALSQQLTELLTASGSDADIASSRSSTPPQHLPHQIRRRPPNASRTALWCR